jgi:hypothetical protein
MRLSPLRETILIDGLDGGHMWGEAENRLTVETLMDLRLVSFIQTRMASGQLDGRTPSGVSDSGRKLARELKAARAHSG